MIYLTGDTHGDFSRFSTKKFPEQKHMTKDDYVIILGDFGGIWADGPNERWWLEWLNGKNFTTLFIDGNHENFDRLYSGEFEEVDFCGGRAHKIRDSVYHLMRGHVFNLQGKSFFCFGGAASHDIHDGILNKEDPDFKEKYAMLWNSNAAFRVNHVSWWEQELPSEDEMELGRTSLENVGYNVDYVLTHCLPSSALLLWFRYATSLDTDRAVMYLESLLHNGLKFDKWYCGHYHAEDSVLGKFILMYDSVRRLV